MLLNFFQNKLSTIPKHNLLSQDANDASIFDLYRACGH